MLEGTRSYAEKQCERVYKSRCGKPFVCRGDMLKFCWQKLMATVDAHESHIRKGSHLVYRVTTCIVKFWRSISLSVILWFMVFNFIPWQAFLVLFNCFFRHPIWTVGICGGLWKPRKVEFDRFKQLLVWNDSSWNGFNWPTPPFMIIWCFNKGPPWWKC